MRNSELAELWEEGAAEASENEWLAVLTRLIDRLNPDSSPRTGPQRIWRRSAGRCRPAPFAISRSSRTSLDMMTLFDA